MDTATLEQVAAAISDATGAPFKHDAVSHIGGGCINQALRLSDGPRSYFVKFNARASLSMFEAERDGLAELAAPGIVTVPGPVAAGAAGDTAFLVLEFIDMTPLAGDGWRRLGERLARLHRSTGASFGWHRDNTIGATPQVNDPAPDWPSFWREHRLGYQLRRAAENGLDDAAVRNGRRLMEALDRLLDGYEPAASLLHGDLWGGNVAADADGAPVLFDPAVYYGDREADLAMSELFGRFDPAFYEAYQAEWPLEPGYAERRELYNLYHVLNHYNLFGGGYGARAGSMIERLLGAVG